MAEILPLINALNMVVVQRLIFAVDRRDTAAVDQHFKFLCLYTKIFFFDAVYKHGIFWC